MVFLLYRRRAFIYACAIRSAFFVEIIKERGLLASLSLVELFIFSASRYLAFVLEAICLHCQYEQFSDDLFAPPRGPTSTYVPELWLSVPGLIGLLNGCTSFLNIWPYYTIYIIKCQQKHNI